MTMTLALTDPGELAPDEMARLLREQAAEIGRLQADVLFFADAAAAQRERADQLRDRLTVLCRERQHIGEYLVATADRLTGHAANGRTVRIRSATDDGAVLPIKRHRGRRRSGRVRWAIRAVARFLVHWHRIVVTHRDRLLQVFPFLCTAAAVAIWRVWGG